MKVERINKRLSKQYTTGKKELLSNVLYTNKESGQLEQALKEWDKKADDEKTWANCKTYVTKEYVNHHKHEAVKAKQAGFSNQCLESQTEEGNSIELSELTDKIAQQLRSQEATSLNEIVHQQKEMLEANQKLMNQLMQNVLNIKGHHPSNKNRVCKPWEAEEQQIKK